MRTLRQCLLDCDLALLRVIAERWGMEPSTNRQRDVAAELAAHMAAPEAQADLASSLTPGEREALEALTTAGGQMPVGTFTRRFGEIRLMGPGRLEREQPWSDPQSVTESLWYTGLIYRVFDEGPGGVQEVIYIPPELRAGLQDWDVLQVEGTVALQLVPLPDQIGYAERQANVLANDVRDDVCTMLAYAHQHALSPAPCNDAWLGRHQALVAQITRYKEPGYLEFLIHLVRQGGLLKLDDQRLRPDPKCGVDWLRASSFDQARTLFESWRDDPTWNELWLVPGLHCEDTGSWENDPLVARQVILDYLVLMQPGQWHGLDEFIEAIKVERPDFQRPGGDYDTWYIRDAQTGDYLRGFESWDNVDGALLRYLLACPLGWLNVVEAVEAAFKLTETGAALLGKSDPPPERGDTRFEVTGEGVVRVGNARRYERFQLSRVADWLQVKSVTVAEGAVAAESIAATDSLAALSQCRRVWVFQITPASLDRARWQRIGVERVVKFLEESAGQPLPETLIRALHRWEEHGPEVWGEQVFVLRVAHPKLLDQLLGTPATRRLIREQLSSTVATVLPEHWPALQQALLEIGVLVG